MVCACIYVQQAAFLQLYDAKQIQRPFFEDTQISGTQSENASELPKPGCIAWTIGSKPEDEV